jgi:ATP-binding cassette subfamily G (WHITE) protein 2 (SNQ2)
MADPQQVELEEIAEAPPLGPQYSPRGNVNESPRRPEEVGSVVNVNAAVQIFHDLDVSVKEDARKVGDVEKGGAEGWDIHEFFEDSVRKGEQTGHKLKRMGVIVKNLNILGMGADAASIPDNLDILKALWPPTWFKRNKGTPFHILKDINAFCKDGEMLLVLGRPGAGCSSFLRVVANERSIFLDVTGEVSYGGLDAKEFTRYQGEAIYTPEEDTHFPMLTLKQTLTFALRCKTPGVRLPDESRRDFRQKVMGAILQMFGLVNQVHTLVGNEYVPGLSGGERKRTTISEAMVSRGAIDCWDCSTRGLDAASAYDYAKSLRVITNTLHKTTLASFYQASENIYEQFDRVLVLDKGRCIFFGHAKEAKPYFERLGFLCENRKSTPDFLTGLTNPQERKIRPGAENVPTNSVDLEEAYKRSPEHDRAMQEMREYEQSLIADSPIEDFKKEFLAQKAKRAGKKSIYSASIWEQIGALVARQGAMFWGDKFGIFSRYFSVIVQGLVFGSVFYNMPLTATGGFTRGGALFSSLLFNAFLSQGELFGTFYGRRIIQKQKSYAMYHPFAYHLAQVVIDIPVTFVQCLGFSIITYFMYGLDPQADKFFVHVFILTLAALCITNFFRALGNLSPSLYLSQQFMGLLFILLLTYVGYFPSKDKMKPWLGWIFYIDPFAYAFKALFANEMKGLVFNCDKDSHVPLGSDYTDPAYRVCSLPGALPGQTSVRAEVYLKEVYGFDVDDRASDIIVVLAFWIFFTLVNAIAVEKIEWTHGGFMRRLYKRGKAPKQNDDAAEQEIARKAALATENMQPIEMSAGMFLWDELCYTVPVTKQPDGSTTRQLLDHVNGWIKPGQMTALMGASGAGKTTLLDVLAQRKTQGKVEGLMLLNGKPLRIDFERITGYVEQLDVHNGYLTVREALQYSAKLRQEPEVPLEEKLAYVERVLEMMEMTQLGDAIIGDLESGHGISVEERKRLTIGMELVAKPHILFLDEPTSGLDSQSSYNIIKFIRKLADAGMPLVCTIHQPSSVLFEYFDRLLLLGKGGKVTYFGDIGDNSRVLLDYFERNGARRCTPEENPAEYLLEAIGAGVGGKTDKDWVQIWRSSPEAASIRQELEEVKKNMTGQHDDDIPREFATTKMYQLKQLYVRFNIIFWRNPSYNVGRILQSLLVGLVVGFSFWDLGVSTSDLNMRVLAIFQILVLGIMLIGAAMPQFLFMRELFKRDYSSKYYSSTPFGIAMFLVEIPYLVLAASLCIICCYWASGFDVGDNFDGFYFWIAFVLFIIYCHSFGMFVAAASPHMAVAMIILPILITFLFLFAGVLTPPSQMPKFWESWMYHLDPFRYFMEGVITTALAPVTIICTKDDFLRFYAPPGVTCGNYTESFLSYATGYINNPNAVDQLCEYCSFKTGNEFLNTLEWDIKYRWRDFGILVGYLAFNLILTVIFVWVFRKQWR